MATLSLAMIVRNEELTLRRVLECAKPFCDELIVVDTGSTDRTIEIAKECGAQVYRFEWIDDFAAARNFSFSKCSCEWILWLDADDFLPPETIEIGKKIKAELLERAEVDCVFGTYIYAKDAEGKPHLTQSRERFLRRSANPTWEGRIHEIVRGCENAFVRCPEFVVHHDTAKENEPRKAGRNLTIYEKYLNVETASTRDLYLYAGELRAVKQFEKAAEVYKKYLEKWPADMYDLFEEPYVVHIDLAETYRQLGRPRDAIETAVKAVAYNGSRAEAYALIGLTQYELGNYSAAFPAFLGAAACKPPKHGGLVYHPFYSSVIHDMIKECKLQLEAAK